MVLHFFNIFCNLFHLFFQGRYIPCRCVVINRDQQRIVVFSRDVRLFFSKPTNNSKTTAESSTLFIEHILQYFFCQAGPGCIHGVAACSYITAHLILWSICKIKYSNEIMYLWWG